MRVSGVFRRVGLAQLIVGMVVLGSARPAVTSDDRWTLRPPVEASVADPFRLDHGPYGPGNRGIEYATNPGAPIMAAGPGWVVFVGPVAGSVYVSIAHAGGLRTAYGGVDTVSVSVGDEVEGGDLIATAGGPLHFSTRLDGEYVDPALLFGRPRVRARLVPHELDLDSSYVAGLAIPERWALYNLHHRQPEPSGGASPVVARILRAVVDHVDPSMRTERLTSAVTRVMGVGHLEDRRLVVDQALAYLTHSAEFVLFPEECTSPDVARGVGPPPGRRVAVVVDGLGSTSSQSGIADELKLADSGYRAVDVVRFSYRGGVVPPPRPDPANLWGLPQWVDALDHQHYEPRDTFGSIHVSAQRFADLLVAVRAANPGTPIDVYGYSLGGVVARMGLVVAGSDADVAFLATVGSPHQGVPAATVADGLSEVPLLGLLVGLGSTDETDLLSSQAVTELAEHGSVAASASQAIPTETIMLSVGGRADAIVPGHLARADGADHVIVGGTFDRSAHQHLASHPDTQQALRLARAGYPPVCTAVTDRLLDRLVPELVAGSERLLAAGVAATALA